LAQPNALKDVLEATLPASLSDPRERVAAWFGQYHAPLYRYLVRLVGDEEQAADLLQETFLRAFRALAARAVPSSPPAWLYRIATNLAYDALRRRRRLRWLGLTGREAAPAFEPDVETAQAVRRCLARLPGREAEALLLYEYAGLSCGENAALAHETPTAVQMRLSRARRRFRDLYDGEVV
jgi:RNA polymerase sigma-70 factor (ECF subfamily)